MQRIFYIITFIILFSFGLGAQSNYLGFSFGAGIKSDYNQFGILTNARLFKHLDIDFGYARSKFSGDGISTGISYVPLNKKLQPFIGIQYLRTFGQRFNVGNDANTTELKVLPCEFFYGKVGIKYKLALKEQIVENMLAFVSLCFSYRYTSYSDNTVRYVSGPTSYKDESYFNGRIGGGYGFSVALTFLFGKKNKSKAIIGD